jgi:PAT family beta-lactamase induction signal transducer AmpG
MTRARPRWLDLLAFAVTSRRTLAVVALSFSSGLPLGLVWIAVPDWMASVGISKTLVGMTTLAHAPWTFKMLWSPLMDRYPFPWLGRRRGWIAICQLALLATTLGLAAASHHPDAPWVIISVCLAIAFASASQDIVIDAYVVDVLRPEEQGVAVGARLASYRVAMNVVSGALGITLVQWLGWSVVAVILALLYLPLLIVTLLAPESERPIPPPPSLRDAVWLPFLGFLRRHRALEILAFVLTYKLGDNLAEALLRPFLGDMGYDATARGVGLGTIGYVATVAGTLGGGALCTVWGLGRCLWLFGCLQIFSNVGYILVAQSAVNLPLMYGAMGFESLTKGMGMGAFGVLLVRLTQKRFSATQYALFSSLFALPRLIAGPITGVLVDRVGWVPFFWFTMAMGIPGLILLARFVPPGVRDPVFTVEAPRTQEALTPRGLVTRALAGALAGTALALFLMSALVALGGLREDGGFDVLGPLVDMLTPSDVRAWLELFGALVFGTLCGLFTAAVFAARSGATDEAGETA